MAIRITGRWDPVLPFLIEWLETDPALTGVHVVTTLPEHVERRLPLVALSLAPGGRIDSYTRSQGVDVDAYADGQAALGSLAGLLETRLAALQGAGNPRGYADSSVLDTFTQIDSGMPGIVRATATITIDMRPRQAADNQ